MNFNNFKITKLCLELSSECEALCVGCIRTARNYSEANPHIKRGVFLEEEILLNIFNSKTTENLDCIEFSGNIDDPLSYPNFLNVLEMIERSSFNGVVNVYTNGFLGTPVDHFELGKKLLAISPNSRIIYGIDGLGEVANLLKFGIKTEAVLKNMKSAIDSGIPVTWKFFEFNLNKHQVESAREMARDLGCNDFFVREDGSDAYNVNKDLISILRNVTGYHKERENFDLDSYWQKINKRKVSCRAIMGSSRTLFIDHLGKVWPCTFMSNKNYIGRRVREEFDSHVLKNLNEDFNDLHKNSLDSVLKEGFFNDLLTNSWSNETDKRSWYCREKCENKAIKNS